MEMYAYTETLEFEDLSWQLKHLPLLSQLKLRHWLITTIDCFNCDNALDLVGLEQA